MLLVVLMLAGILVAPIGAQPIAQYTFDDGTAMDVTGNGYDGILLSDPDAAAQIVEDPEMGQVLKLNGRGMQVDGPLDITTSFTLSAWIKIDIPRTGRFFFGGPWRFRTDDQSGSDHVWIEIRYPEGSFLNKVDTTFGGADPDGQLDGQWHHYVFILPEDGAFQVYFDGVLAPFRDANPVRAHDFGGSVGPLFFGTQNEIFGNALQGYMDDISIYNRALTPEEIQAPEPAGVTIPVEAGGDIAAANALAQAGDTIDIAAGTFVLAEQIEIKDGVTYQGAGADLTILDCNNLTRAFAAWGDRGATNGQVDANGVGVPNTTGPTGWVISGLTIQNGETGDLNRQDILSAARDLLNNYTGTPYTLATAQAENGGVTDNPGWFDVLSGSADDDLTDEELQSYLDGNPPGSAGHLIVNDDADDSSGALGLSNGASGTLRDCAVTNCHADDDGGATSVAGASSLNVSNCSFSGLSCGDDGGAIKVANASSLNVSNCSFSGISCGDDGGLFKTNSQSSVMVDHCLIVDSVAGDQGGVGRVGDDGDFFSLTNCIIDNVDADDDGAVFRSGASGSGGLFMANCIAMNCDAADDGVVWLRGASNKVLNCTFVRNTCGDKGIIMEDTDSANAGAEHVYVNNIFYGNSNLGSGDDLFSQRTDLATHPVTVTNNLFFGNTIDTGEIGLGVVIGTDGNVESDPLFVGPDDFHIASADSLAVDGGTDVGLTEDIDGNVRPQGNATDIGAYESSFAR